MTFCLLYFVDFGYDCCQMLKLSEDWPGKKIRLIGALQIVAQSKPHLGESPFTGNTEQLILVVIGNYKP